MKKRKRFFQRLTGWLTALTLLAGSAVGYYHYTLPDQFRVTAGTKLRLNQTGLSIIDTVNKEEITASALKSANQNYHAQLMLFDVIPIKTVSVKVVQEKLLVPCGTPFGIKMFTNGVMVVGVADIESAGKMINPAAVAGVKVGDIITAVNGKAVTQNRARHLRRGHKRAYAASQRRRYLRDHQRNCQGPEGPRRRTARLFQQRFPCRPAAGQF